MRIIVLGAHPDDPESGCGGLAVNAVQSGHEVLFVHATAFRAGRLFFGRPEREVRTEEAKAAASVLGVDVDVLDYAHGTIHVHPENVARFKTTLLERHPDVVIAHWPVDTHPDHRCVGTIALSVYLDPEARFDFYFFEVMTGQQSLHFHPTHYVDISDAAETKHRALLCHRSQDGERVWQSHEVMHRLRGNECGAARAEAYIRVDRKKTVRALLPGMSKEQGGRSKE